MLEHQSQTAQIPLLILAFDSKKHTLKELKRLAFYKAKGLTPEGMCLNALNEFIGNTYKNHKVFYINLNVIILDQLILSDYILNFLMN